MSLALILGVRLVNGTSQNSNVTRSHIRTRHQFRRDTLMQEKVRSSRSEEGLYLLCLRNRYTYPRCLM